MKWFFGCAVALAACASDLPPPRAAQPFYPPPPPNYAGPPAVAPGGPLPSGWSWPGNFQQAAAQLGTLFIPQPVDTGALGKTAGQPCAPVNLGNNHWVPSCDLGTAFNDLLRGLPTRPAVSYPGQLPTGVDLRLMGLDGPVKDQAMVGSCSKFAISTLVDNRLRLAGRAEVISPLHVIANNVWYRTQNGKEAVPLTVEPAWPYDPVRACRFEDGDAYCERAYHVQSNSWQADPQLVAERQRADQYAVALAYNLQQISAEPDEIAKTIALGQSVLASFQIDTIKWSRSGPVLPEDAMGSSGHGVALVGYSGVAPGRSFLIHNSWGNDWAEGGYAWMSEGLLRRSIQYAMVLDALDIARNPMPRRAVQPIPPQRAPAQGASGPAMPLGFPQIPGSPFPQGGSAQGCAPGLVSDAVFRTCVNACQDGQPPSAGICAGAMPPGFPNFFRR